MGDLDGAAVGAQLGLGDAWRPWLLELEASGPPPVPVALPDPLRESGLLDRLGVQPADASDLLDAWPQPARTPALWWLLERCQARLLAHLGNPDSPYLPWLPLPPHLGAEGRLFYAYVYLATLPAIRQWHRARGLPDDLSWATLADLGEHLAIHRRMYGTASLDRPGWLSLHFRGLLFRLGRLQFQRGRFPPDWPVGTSVLGRWGTGAHPGPGALALDIHIPESGGPLSPAACSASLAQARDVFARSFSEEPYRFARCASWLLDPQLAAYLPPTSNIVRFQRLFHLAAGGDTGDAEILRFVFRRVEPTLDALPQRTTLERAVVEHLRAGQHWQVRSGWLVLSWARRGQGYNARPTWTSKRS